MSDLGCTKLILLFGLQLAAAQNNVPKIWDDKALEDWATPIAALGVRPGHFSAAEYYAVPADNLKTYPVYRPDKEPPGYWEWLQKQRPEPLVDASKIHTGEDWIKAGAAAFRGIDVIAFRTSDPEKIRQARTMEAFRGVWTQADGSLTAQRWVVTPSGLQLSVGNCSACHQQVQADDTVLWGGTQVPPPHGNRSYNAVNVATILPIFRGDPRPVADWRQSTVPWDPDPRIEKLLEPGAGPLTVVKPGWGTASRIHGSPFFPIRIPDLHTLKFSRYMDATGTHRLRGPEDVARYVAFIAGADSMEFGQYKILKPEQRRVPVRHADEVLYAIGMYVMSLEPPRNPDRPPAALAGRGREIFARESCVNCHIPPNYTSGKLTPAQGFTPPAGHPNQADIVNISVGTDPGLAIKTRKGTGFYKIPSLRGVWYRPLLLHDGWVASLEEMFDPDRLKPDHVPGGRRGPGVTKRAIPGHPFGLALNAEDKQALLAFLRSL